MPAPHSTHTHKSHSYTPLLCEVLNCPAVISERCYLCLFSSLLILDCYPVSDCSLPATTWIIYWTLILAACLDSLPDSRLCLSPVSIVLFTGVYSAYLTILIKSSKWIQLSLMLHNKYALAWVDQIIFARMEQQLR